MSNFWSDSQAGTSSYPTGGFTIVTGLASVANFDVQVGVPGANLGQSIFDITLNSPSAGSVKVKVMCEKHDAFASIGSVTGLPSGVSLATTSGQLTDTSTHTHDMTHNHAASAASTTMAGQNAASLAVALQPAFTTHTHTVDLPSFAGNMTANTAHTHTWNNIYQHQHVLTNTQTDLSPTELANGTNLSGTTFIFLGTDS